MKRSLLRCSLGATTLPGTNPASASLPVLGTVAPIFGAEFRHDFLGQTPDAGPALQQACPACLNPCGKRRNRPHFL
jgi:hypothetical protein